MRCLLNKKDVRLGCMRVYELEKERKKGKGVSGKAHKAFGGGKMVDLHKK